jgi:glutamate-1-semialdehyde 2,1-aminomutase
LAVTAGLETLKRLKGSAVYKKLEERASALERGLAEAARKANVPLRLTRVGSMMSAFFTKEPVVDYASAKQSNTQAYSKFFHRMLNEGIYLAPSQFEAAFLSTAHTAADIEKTLAAARAALQKL